MHSPKFTKYDYTQFLNCPEELLLKRNMSELLPAMTDDDLHNIEQGNLVDSLAKDLFQDESFLESFGVAKNKIEFLVGLKFGVGMFNLIFL